MDAPGPQVHQLGPGRRGPADVSQHGQAQARNYGSADSGNSNGRAGRGGERTRVGRGGRAGVTGVATQINVSVKDTTVTVEAVASWRLDLIGEPGLRNP